MKKSKISKVPQSRGSSSSRPGDIARATAERNPITEQMLLQSKILTQEQPSATATAPHTSATMCPLCRRTKGVTLVEVVPGVLGHTDYVHHCPFDPYTFVISVKDDKARRF